MPDDVSDGVGGSWVLLAVVMSVPGVDAFIPACALLRLLVLVVAVKLMLVELLLGVLVLVVVLVVLTGSSWSGVSSEVVSVACCLSSMKNLAGAYRLASYTGNLRAGVAVTRVKGSPC